MLFSFKFFSLCQQLCCHNFQLQETHYTLIKLIRYTFPHIFSFLDVVRLLSVVNVLRYENFVFSMMAYFSLELPFSYLSFSQIPWLYFSRCLCILVFLSNLHLQLSSCFLLIQQFAHRFNKDWHASCWFEFQPK